jgi:hypothetical protein
MIRRSFLTLLGFLPFARPVKAAPPSFDADRMEAWLKSTNPRLYWMIRGAMDEKLAMAAFGEPISESTLADEVLKLMIPCLCRPRAICRRPCLMNRELLPNQFDNAKVEATFWQQQTELWRKQAYFHRKINHPGTISESLRGTFDKSPDDDFWREQASFWKQQEQYWHAQAEYWRLKGKVTLDIPRSSGSIRPIGG